MTMIFVRLIAWPCSTESSNNLSVFESCPEVWPMAVQWFCQEWRSSHVLAGLVRTDHPNVLMLHETFEDKSHLYLVRVPGAGWTARAAEVDPTESEGRKDVNDWLRDDARCCIGQITPNINVSWLSAAIKGFQHMHLGAVEGPGALCRRRFG